jgi:putative membrane-bound dehydrogenase-like protein
MKYFCQLSFAGALLAAAFQVGATEKLGASADLKSLVTEADVAVELVAAEPIVFDPVAVSWDASGRMFVAENRGYPVGPETGVIAMVEDTDGDGRMDKRTEFATGIPYPNGLMPWRGGFFVTSAPEVYYFKDTTGDGKADVRKVVLTGYMTNSTTQIRVAHPKLGLDGWVYVTAGLTGGKVKSPQHGEREATEFKRSDSRFNPDSLVVEQSPGVGQFGLCFDDFGRKFICSNRNPLKHIVLHPRYLKRNKFFAFSKFDHDVAAAGTDAICWPLSEDTTTAGFHPRLMATPHAGTFTSACGISIYRGNLLPSSFYGSAICCEPAQNLVQRQTLAPRGGTFTGTPATSGNEFLASADTWFRPVYSANGPDGAAYICDMHRKILDHPRYLPEHIRDTLDYGAGKDKGRIYRLIRKGARTRTLPKLPADEPAKLASALNHANAWTRETAFRLLTESKAPEVLQQLRKTRLTNPAARVAAYRLIANRSQLTDAEVVKMLNDSSPRVREHGIQLGETRLQNQAITSRIRQLATDSDSMVRFKTALVLGFDDAKYRNTSLANIASQIGTDEFSAAAVMSSLDAVGIEYVARHLLNTGEAAKAPALMASLGQAVGRSAKDSQTLHLIELLSRNKSPAGIEWKTSFTDGLAKGLRTRGLGKGLSPFADLAKRNKSDASLDWLFEVAEKQAQNRKAAEPIRLAAIGFLANSSVKDSAQELQSLVSPAESIAVQSAALRTLGKYGDTKIGEWLIETKRWRAYSPQIRNALVSAFLSHSKLLPLLVTAIEDGRVPAWAVPEPKRRSLMRNRDKDLKARATKLFSAMGGADRKKVYDELKAITEKTGDAAKGKAVYTRTCATCHKFRGEGHTVGPDLSSVRNQPKDALLLHIIVPNAEIYPGLTAYEVETKDDRSLTGIMISETDTSLTIRAAQGIEETFLRTDILRLSASSGSLMPNELEKTMTREELIDLLEFLKSN